MTRRRPFAVAAAAAWLCAASLGGTGCAGADRSTPRPAAPTVISAVWSPDAGGLCVTLSGAVSTGSSLLPGGDFELRLSGPSLDRPIFRVPSGQGRTCFELARTPAAFRRLRPGPVTVDAMIMGEVIELATTQLDRPTIDRLADIALRRGLAREGPASPGGAAEIELWTEPDAVAAGQPFTIRGRASNTGDRPVFKLAAAVTPDSDVVPGSTIEFGWLEPGETLEVSVPAVLPRAFRGERLELAAVPTELHNAAITAPERFAVDVDPLPPPAIETVVTVTPDRHGRSVKTGREGELRPGDDLHMVVEIRNFGDTDLRGGVAELRSPDEGNASVRVGRAVVGDLPPGGSTRAHFWFVVRAALGSGRVPMLIEVTDADLGIVHEQAVVLEIESD